MLTRTVILRSDQIALFNENGGPDPAEFKDEGKANEHENTLMLSGTPRRSVEGGEKGADDAAMVATPMGVAVEVVAGTTVVFVAFIAIPSADRKPVLPTLLVVLAALAYSPLLG